MGHSSSYECSDCGYRSVVSERRDRGFSVMVEPRICCDCRELKNVRIGSPKQPLDPEDPVCPVCGSSNTRLWKNHACPKCPGTMERGGINYFWD